MEYAIFVLEQQIKDHEIGLERIDQNKYQPYSVEDYKSMIEDLIKAIKILRQKRKVN